MSKNKKESKPVQVLLTPKYILITGKFLTKISPFLASRFGAKLFLTPFKYKLPKREKEMDDDSFQKDHLVPVIDRKIIIYEYGEGTKTILLAHGWSGRGTQMSVLAKELVQKGYRVISFDAPAHGKAPGKMSMMPYFIESIHELEKLYGPFNAAIGHSLGGMSLLRACKEGLNINKLVIIGTANSVTKITREFARNLRLNDKVAGKMKSYFDNKFGENMDNYSGAFSAESVKAPTLIIHDKDDIDVHISSAFEISEKLQNSELYLTEGLGHRKILGDRKVINKITTFLTAQSL